MTLLKITETDVKASTIIKPSRQTLFVSEVTEEEITDEKGTKTSWTVQLLVSGGQYDGVPLRYYISSRGAMFATEFVAAAFNKPLKGGEEVDPCSTKGRYVDAYIINGENSNSGRTENRIKEFFPSKKAEVAV